MDLLNTHDFNNNNTKDILLEHRREPKGQATIDIKCSKDPSIYRYK